MAFFKSPLRQVLVSWAGVLGTLLLISGGLIALILNDITPGVFVCVLAGAGGLMLWMWAAPDELRAWLTGRQTRYGTTSALVTIVFVGAVAYVYVLADRANLTADLTSVQRYTLNPPSLQTIEQLKERGFRVRIVGFFSRNKLREEETADLLLRQYVAAGDGTIEVQYIDPDERPDLAERYGYQTDFDGRFLLTLLDENGEPRLRDTVSEGAVQARYFTLYLGSASERDITTGLKTIVSAGAFKVYFTVGHAERDLTQADDNGISRLFVSLDGQGIAVAPLALADVEEVPDDADAVLIVGPWQDFTQPEVDRLAAYLQRGGRVGIFADPPLVEAAISGAPGNDFLSADGPLATYLWEEFGVRALDALVIETKPELINGSEWMPILNSIAPHTIMNDVRDEPIYSSFVRPLELVEMPNERQNAYVREPLLFTSELSYAETALDDFLAGRIAYDPQADTPGPLLVGVTVRRQLEYQSDIQPRLVILGDSDLFKNEYVKQVPGNVFLWTDVIDWLTGFSQAVSFTPVNDPTLLILNVSAEERNTITLITMLLLPGIVLLTGGLVWWRRQH
ncbi:MAG: Gldg family protein [Anaerolineae bacterium]